MKRNILFTICILISGFTFAQDTTVSRLATFTSSKKIQKLNKEQYLEYGKRNFNKPYASLPNDHVYLTDGLLVTIRDREMSSFKKRTLGQLKIEMEGAFNRTGGNYSQSKILTVNGKQFYIFEYYLKDEGHLSFYTDYVGNNNKNIVGVIDFKRPDEDKAHKHLDELLKNIRFTYDSVD